VVRQVSLGLRLLLLALMLTTQGKVKSLRREIQHFYWTWMDSGTLSKWDFHHPLFESKKHIIVMMPTDGECIRVIWKCFQ